MVQSVTHLGILGIASLAAYQAGAFVRRLHLPLITGFLLVGIVSGPYGLGLFPPEAGQTLRYVDMMALAFIALAAGGELHLREVRSQLKGIIAIILGQTFAVLLVGIAAVVVLAPFIPFVQGMTRPQVVAVGILAATIMVARSPSSAYAIIKELRASGPFTQRVLGVTVLKDALVIVAFALGMSVAAILMEGGSLNVTSLAVVCLEVGLDIFTGGLMALLVTTLFKLPLPAFVKGGGVLGMGFGIFGLSSLLKHWQVGPFHLFAEPLLICMVAGFVVANWTSHRQEFLELVERIAPAIFALFFTSVGAALRVDVLRSTWAIVLVLVLVRALGIFLGSFVGGMVTTPSFFQNAVLGMTFITQAGVSVGLAEEVGVNFPPWGEAFAALTIGTIVVNQLIGPPLFKWAIRLVGEAHTGDELEPANRHVVLVGKGNEVTTLARHLHNHRWHVCLVTTVSDGIASANGDEIPTILASDGDWIGALNALNVQEAGTVVILLDKDEDAYRLCEHLYRNAPHARCVVRVKNAGELARFRELGAIVVHPGLAPVQLLAAAVRSPSVAGVLLGEMTSRDILEVRVRNPAWHGVRLKEIPLPPGVLVLSVRRGNQLLVPHGHTRLELGDHLALFGEPDELQDVALLLEIKKAI